MRGEVAAQGAEPARPPQNAAPPGRRERTTDKASEPAIPEAIGAG
jgi:hypothetical protein